MASLNSDLFEPLQAADDGELDVQGALEIEDLVRIAIDSIKGVMRRGFRAKIGFSGGKDSSVLANLVLCAASEMIQSGETVPPIRTLHSDTGIESPLVRNIADNELHKMKVFAKKMGIPLSVHIARASLATGFAAKIIGGRALPSFPNKQMECSVDWKQVPSRRLSRQLDKESIEADGKSLASTVTLLGTREDESVSRGMKTRKRCESAAQVWKNADGEDFLSPVLHWSTDDVFTYLGYCSAGLMTSYSDFESVMDFYADAGGSSCAVVGDFTVTKNSKPCGARSGCFLCVASTDKSARTMIETNPEKYPYLVPLLRLRDFMAYTECDWSRRNFIARTINDDGYIRIAADQYSPAMCEELLRYSLYAQDAANRLGSPSRVRIVGLRELIAIDFFWSVRGLHKPFHALKIYFEHQEGIRVQAPLMTKPMNRSQPPVLGQIYVGPDWDSDLAGTLGVSGLRDPIGEMFGDSCGISLKTSRSGKVMLDYDEGQEFDVDAEGATFFLDFEAERMIERWHRDDADWTAAASVYLQYGCVTLGKGMSASVDKAIRRSQWRQRHDMHGQRTEQELWARCNDRSARQEGLFAIDTEARETETA